MDFPTPPVFPLLRHRETSVCGPCGGVEVGFPAAVAEGGNEMRGGCRVKGRTGQSFAFGDCF